MRDFEWEYYKEYNDNTDNSVDYIDSMTEGSFYEDEDLYEHREDLTDWESYYQEISEEIEY